MAPQRPQRIASGSRNAVINILPPNLLFGLAVAGMESSEKGPGVILGELGMLREGLTRRLEVLGPGQAVMGL